MKKTQMIIPPIKIQGKKTKIVPKIMEIADIILSEHKEIDTWVEPFLGSGVVAFNCPNMTLTSSSSIKVLQTVSSHQRR